MNFDRMDELARDPKFISGIYNYCDRWCERCAFTDRCLNYAMAREELSGCPEPPGVEDEPLAANADSGAFADDLQEAFDLMLERIEEKAEEMGFDFEDEDVLEDIREQKQVHEAATSQSFTQTAMSYIRRVDEWFKLNEGVPGDKAQALAQADGPGAGSGDAAGDLRDSLEVIRWYQPQIWVKLCRAANGAIRAHLDDMEGMQEDADGSAKVALLGIERSIEAWTTVLARFPDHEDAIFSLTTLKRLLKQVEAAFPNARAFRRPGFDTQEA